MYNFQIEDFYTYYVGDAGVLMHNTCGSGRYASQNKIDNIFDDLEYAINLFE